MTSNTTPSGEAKASRQVSGYEAYKAFNMEYGLSDYWSDNTVANWSNPTWLQYKFDTPVCAKRMTYRSIWSNIWYAKDFQILASNDETNWVTLFEGNNSSDIDNIGEVVTIELNNNEKYLYYRMNFLNSNGGNMMVNSLQLYGYK